MIKKVFYILIISLVMVVALVFVQETQQAVKIDFHSEEPWGFLWQGNLSILLIGTLIVGLVLGYLFSVVSNLRLRGKLMSSNRKLKKAEGLYQAQSKDKPSQELA